MSRAIYLPAPSHRRQGLHSLAYPGLLTDLSLADAAYHHSTTYYSRIVARGLRLWTDGTVTPMVPSFLFVNYHRYCQPFTARRAKANLDLIFWREYFVADYYRSRTYLEVRCNHHLEPDSVFPALSGQQASPWTTLEIGNRSANGKGCDPARTEGMEETKERKKQKSLRLSPRLSLCTLIRIRENRPGIFFYNPFFFLPPFFLYFLFTSPRRFRRKPHSIFNGIGKRRVYWLRLMAREIGTGVLFHPTCWYLPNISGMVWDGMGWDGTGWMDGWMA